MDDMTPDEVKSYLGSLSTQELVELSLEDIATGTYSEDYDEETYHLARAAAISNLAIIQLLETQPSSNTQ